MHTRCAHQKAYGANNPLGVSGGPRALPSHFKLVKLKFDSRYLGNGANFRIRKAIFEKDGPRLGEGHLSDAGFRGTLSNGSILPLYLRSEPQFSQLFPSQIAGAILRDAPREKCI